MTLIEIQNTIKEILNKATISAEDISVDCDEKTGDIWCRIKSHESHLLIGRDGENLSAFNHIARRIFEKRAGIDGQQTLNNILIDVNDYQKGRNENIKSTAHMLSERAIFFKASIEADPMSSYDRRIIHEFLSEKPNIKTESVGEGKNRRVVIKYIEASSI